MITKKELDKRLYRYAVDIVRCVDNFSKDVSSQVIAKQLIRSGTSVVANVVEAKGASSKKDYIKFYLHEYEFSFLVSLFLFET
jgi:four helix bundle protein